MLGVGIAGDVLNLWVFDPFFEGWWTLFIIIPCTVSLIRDGIRISSATGLIIGIMLLAAYYIDINFSVWQLIIPAVLILIGIRIIFQGSYHRIHMERRAHSTNGSGTDYTASAGTAGKRDYSAIFSSNNVRITDQFTGANLNAIFGAVVLDLRDAVINGDVEITATAVFGGIDIFVPHGVQIKVNNVPIFGGVSNKTSYQVAPGAPVIYLNSTCMFGGIDIK